MFKYFCFFLCLSNTMPAQNLDQYRWENRLVLLLTPTTDNTILQEQLRIFAADPDGLTERKLQIIQLSPKQIRLGYDQAKGWKPSNSKLYQQYHTKNRSFEAILIGLDGGIKERDTKPFTLDRLYAWIDAMPMRRAEIQRKKN